MYPYKKYIFRVLIAFTIILLSGPSYANDSKDSCAPNFAPPTETKPKTPDNLAIPRDVKKNVADAMGGGKGLIVTKAFAERVIGGANALIELGGGLASTNSNLIEDQRRANHWNSIMRNIPPALRPYIPSGMWMLDHQLTFPVARNLVKINSFTSVILRTSFPHAGRRSWTNVVIPLDAIVQNRNTEQKYIVGPKAKAVIVFLHGGGTASTGAQAAGYFIEKLAPYNVHVVALDLPFHGLGDRFIAGTASESVEYVLSFIKAHIPRDMDVYIAGHSLGGTFALEATFMSATEGAIPSQVKGLISLSPGLSSESPEAYTGKMQAGHLMVEEAPASERDIFTQMTERGKNSNLGEFYSLITLYTTHHRLHPEALKNTLPTQVIVGKKDALVYFGFEKDFEKLNSLFSALPSHEFHFLEKGYFRGGAEEVGIGHLIQEYKPTRGGKDKDMVIAKMLEFIEKTSNIELPNNVELSNIKLSEDDKPIKNFLIKYINNLAFRYFADHHYRVGYKENQEEGKRFSKDNEARVDYLYNQISKFTPEYKVADAWFNILGTAPSAVGNLGLILEPLEVYLPLYKEDFENKTIFASGSNPNNSTVFPDEIAQLIDDITEAKKSGNIEQLQLKVISALQTTLTKKYQDSQIKKPSLDKPNGESSLRGLLSSMFILPKNIENEINSLIEELFNEPAPDKNRKKKIRRQIINSTNPYSIPHLEVEAWTSLLSIFTKKSEEKSSFYPNPLGEKSLSQIKKLLEVLKDNPEYIKNQSKYVELVYGFIKSVEGKDFTEMESNMEAILEEHRLADTKKPKRIEQISQMLNSYGGLISIIKSKSFNQDELASVERLFPDGDSKNQILTQDSRLISYDHLMKLMEGFNTPQEGRNVKDHPLKARNVKDHPLKAHLTTFLQAKNEHILKNSKKKDPSSGKDVLDIDSVIRLILADFHVSQTGIDRIREEITSDYSNKFDNKEEEEALTLIAAKIDNLVNEHSSTISQQRINSIINLYFIDRTFQKLREAGSADSKTSYFIDEIYEQFKKINDNSLSSEERKPLLDEIKEQIVSALSKLLNHGKSSSKNMHPFYTNVKELNQNTREASDRLKASAVFSSKDGIMEPLDNITNQMNYRKAIYVPEDMKNKKNLKEIKDTVASIVRTQKKIQEKNLEGRERLKEIKKERKELLQSSKIIRLFINEFVFQYALDGMEDEFQNMEQPRLNMLESMENLNDNNLPNLLIEKIISDKKVDNVLEDLLERNRLENEEFTTPFENYKEWKQRQSIYLQNVISRIVSANSTELENLKFWTANRKEQLITGTAIGSLSELQKHLKDIYGILSEKNSLTPNNSSRYSLLKYEIISFSKVEGSIIELENRLAQLKGHYFELSPDATLGGIKVYSTNELDNLTTSGTENGILKTNKADTVKIMEEISRSWKQMEDYIEPLPHEQTTQ